MITMTENDAIRYLEIMKTLTEENSVGYLQKQMYEKAISALEEVKQYREIGTVERVKKLKEMKLKPCPFCGGKAAIYAGDGVCVICKKCGCRTKSLADRYSMVRTNGGAIDAVIKRWNRREGDVDKGRVNVIPEQESGD